MQDVRTWIDQTLKSVDETRISVRELSVLRDKAAKWDREWEAQREYLVELKPDGSALVETVGGQRRRVSCDVPEKSPVLTKSDASFLYALALHFQGKGLLGPVDERRFERIARSLYPERSEK